MKTKILFLRNWMIGTLLAALGLIVAVPLIVAHGWPAAVTQSAAISLESAYLGSVKLNWAVPGVYSDTLTAPAGELPELGSIDLGFLLHCSQSQASGYVDLDATLVFTGTHVITTVQSETPLAVGPAVSGTCGKDNWQIESEPFDQLTGAGQSITRQFQLIGEQVAPNIYAGEYRETLWGYGPQPLTIVGDFELIMVSQETQDGYGIYLPLIQR